MGHLLDIIEPDGLEAVEGSDIPMRQNEQPA
jgi:3,4-dihydroxy 2-butanone 4-phosphate synthase/GTP cyclohydrolase II